MNEKKELCRIQKKMLMDAAAPPCHVYNECMNNNNERLFCSRGSSVCSFEKRWCLCLHCPNEIEYRLNSFVYCEKGAATEKNVAVKTLK